MNRRDFLGMATTVGFTSIIPSDDTKATELVKEASCFRAIISISPNVDQKEICESLSQNYSKYQKEICELLLQNYSKHQIPLINWNFRFCSELGYVIAIGHSDDYSNIIVDIKIHEDKKAIKQGIAASYKTGFPAVLFTVISDNNCFFELDATPRPGCKIIQIWKDFESYNNKSFWKAIYDKNMA